jgi:endonuclease/exonuclease/phosphatase family metal-dependent hydrolase
MKREVGLKILSYNIHKGFSAGNLTFVLERMKASIREVDADLVFLQEVLGHTAQFEYIADTIWPHFAYGRNAVYTSGHHGNAILSKYPIKSWENIDVSPSKLERRGILHAVIDMPGRKRNLHAICLHLGLFEADRKRQVEQLCARISRMVPPKSPLVVAGDFNDWRGSATGVLEGRLGMSEAFQKLHGESPRTFPIWMPVLRLDRIYLRGLTAKTALCLTSAPWNELSDHAAIYSEVAA